MGETLNGWGRMGAGNEAIPLPGHTRALLMADQSTPELQVPLGHQKGVYSRHGHTQVQLVVGTTRATSSEQLYRTHGSSVR